MSKVFHAIMEVVGWLQIAASPSLLGLLIGAVVYFSNPNMTTFVLGLVIVVLGITVGIFWATRIWKKHGTVWYMSRIMASPELDNLKNRTQMSDKSRIIQAITDFVKGGDTSNVALLEKVLHPDFTVSSSNFMGNPGVMIMDKQKYLSNIREGIFGGLPRNMNIETIDENDSIAMVKLRLESMENYFVSYNSLVLDLDGEWKLIHNLAVVEAKK